MKKTKNTKPKIILVSTNISMVRVSPLNICFGLFCVIEYIRYPLQWMLHRSDRQIDPNDLEIIESLTSAVIPINFVARWENRMSLNFATFVQYMIRPTTSLDSRTNYTRHDIISSCISSISFILLNDAYYNNICLCTYTEYVYNINEIWAKLLRFNF